MWQEMRSALVGLVTVGVLLGLGPAVAAAVSDANRLVRVSGTSPFTGCPAAALDSLLPTGEVEPVVVANPTDRANVVAAWTQDRFRGVVAGVSLDRGRTWRSVVVPGLTRCTGGAFDYADDVSMSAGSDGVVHLSTHVFDADRQRSGLLATRSTDGGRTWRRPAALAVQTGSRDGEYAGGAIAADPADPRMVYAVVPTFSSPSQPGGSFRGTVIVARSLDGGTSWQPPRGVLDTGADRLTTGHQLAVLPDGTLLDVLVLIDLRQDPRQPTLQVAVLRSNDLGGGLTGVLAKVDEHQDVQQGPVGQDRELVAGGQPIGPGVQDAARRLPARATVKAAGNDHRSPKRPAGLGGGGEGGYHGVDHARVGRVGSNGAAGVLAVARSGLHGERGGPAPGPPAVGGPGGEQAAALPVGVEDVCRQVHHAVGAGRHRHVVGVVERATGTAGETGHDHAPPGPAAVEADTGDNPTEAVLGPRGHDVGAVGRVGDHDRFDLAGGKQGVQGGGRAAGERARARHPDQAVGIRRCGRDSGPQPDQHTNRDQPHQRRPQLPPHAPSPFLASIACCYPPHSVGSLGVLTAGGPGRG